MCENKSSDRDSDNMRIHKGVKEILLKEIHEGTNIVRETIQEPM